MPRSKADWSRPLPSPILIGRRRLKTLACLRSHLLALPADRQSKRGWHAVAGALLDASRGGDVARLTMAVSLARMLDRRP